MLRSLTVPAFLGGVCLLGCGSTSAPVAAPAAAADAPAADASAGVDDAGSVTLRSDVTPVTTAGEAEPGAFIPGFVSCQAPVAGHAPAVRSDGMVCTNVAIAGATEQGRYFPSYAACDVVRTQRPYYSAPPHATPSADDPRLKDALFMKELAWVTNQVRATACTCCHDGSQAPDGASQWDITAGPIWTDTASDAAIALFSGLADSSIFGHYPPESNNGFERTTTGLPSTDAARMQSFWFAELARRNISQEQAAATPPFGAPLIAALRAPPSTCAKGIGLADDGTLHWGGGTVRYVFVLDPSAPNPDLPPASDPAGTLWRLDVLASADPLHSGLAYGTTPPGTFQAVPAAGRAPGLMKGATYHLFTFVDMGIVGQNCLFVAPGGEP